MVAPGPGLRAVRANPRAKRHRLYRLRMDMRALVHGAVVETLQSTPLLRTLRAGHRPDRAGLPVDGGRSRRWHSTGRQGHPPRPGCGTRAGDRLWSALRSLRLKGLVFLCTTGAAPATAAYFAGIPQRSGVGGGIGLLLAGGVKPRRAENQAETWLRLAEVAGVHQQLHSPVFEPGPEARQRTGPPTAPGTAMGACWSQSRLAPDTRRPHRRPPPQFWDPGALGTSRQSAGSAPWCRDAPDRLRARPIRGRAHEDGSASGRDRPGRRGRPGDPRRGDRPLRPAGGE